MDSSKEHRVRSSRLCFGPVGPAVGALFLVFLMAGPALGQPEKVGTIYELVKSGKFKAGIVSNGTYQSIRVGLQNLTDDKYKVKLPFGTVVRSGDKRYQSLALVVTASISVGAKKQGYVDIKTACMHPHRGVAPKGFAKWTVGVEPGLRQLLEMFYQYLESLGGPEFLGNEKERHNFLQACVWMYYDTSKRMMLVFAKKYMFGKPEEAQLFVDEMYPMAESFLAMYKQSHSTRGSGN